MREELSPTNEYQFVEQLEGFICEEIRPGQSTYQLTNLEPATYYQVNVRANNVHGLSDDSMYIFKTKSGEFQKLLPLLYIIKKDMIFYFKKLSFFF